jgi:CO/xanthine dehydrogenase FAD-binding subunit
VLSKFDYVRTQVLEEALAYLGKNAGTKILAGGTDLMVMLRRNVEMPEHVLDIKSIPETKRLEYKPQEGLFIGASITVNQVAEAEFIQKKYTALAQAANSLASYQLRNRATLVGNICNASPGADLSGPLLVYEAKVHIANCQGERVVDVNEFFTGVKKTVLKQGDLVVGVSLPDVGDEDVSLYLKQTRIKGHDLGIVGVAARLTAEKKCFVAMSAVAPTPIRLTKLEAMINSQPLTTELAALAGEEARNQIKPISDMRSSAEYRLHVSGVLVKRALSQLLTMGGR